MAEDPTERDSDGALGEPEVPENANVPLINEPDPDVAPTDPTIRRRIAQTFRDQLTVEAGSEMFSNVREVAFPLAALVLMLVVVITFRAVLLPFILACALVFLMEPIVRFICGRPIRGRGLPRWVAVILVYLSFIFVVTLSSLFVVPTFVTEIVRFAEEIPDYVQDFRNEQLPSINHEVQEFLKNYLPVKTATEASGAVIAQRSVLHARESAARYTTALSNAKSRVRRAAETEVVWRLEEVEGSTIGTYIVRTPEKPVSIFTYDDATESSGWTYGQGSSEPGFVITPERGGGMRVVLNDVALEVEETGEKSWVLRQKQSDRVPVRDDTEVEIDEMFNLERRVDEIIEGLVSTSNDRIASVIEFAQKLLVGIVGAFVGMALTLMVAAFMSIDLPRMMGFVRSLVPRRMREGYDVLLVDLDRGLSGVVRGQLVICLVNGVLTWIGLAIMGVKFSVLLAVIAGIMSLIPVFGTILSTIPIVLIALTGGFMKGVGALVWILVIHAIEANLLNPKIIGSSAHIHPVIVIFALLAGESAYGLVGALLAVPTASILLTLFNFVRTRAWRQADTREPSA